LFAQDNKALPGVKMHPCPECGKALLRIKWKNDFFWACSANRGYRARDEQGKPGAAQKSAVVHSEHVCPQCGKALARREGERGPWWSCTGFKDGCKYKAPDNDGSPGTPQEKPVARGKFKCPECGKELEYIRAKSGINWFICKNEKKHRAKKTRFFKDNDGTPILET
jgi:ssDNA-binding Zn-finger/Zn-ribbon topoisomerase 1